MTDAITCRDSVPVMVTRDVSTYISDSGVVRYKIITDEWKVYDRLVPSRWTFEQGIYLENPFLRTEQGKTYVYVSGADGKLEKRAVTTGKALWGSYTEVLSGITAEDLIAFPYGKTVIPGADTVESDLSELYG